MRTYIVMFADGHETTFTAPSKAAVRLHYAGSVHGKIVDID